MDLFFRVFVSRPITLMAFLCLTMYLTLLLTPVAADLDDDKPSVYEILKDYDFPVGLLPKGVLGYDLNKTSGNFSVSWNGTCSFSLESSYQLKYQSTIKGIISKDKLSNLQGVSVKILFFWVNIVEVTRKGDELEFSVGIASANFPLDNFEERPQCGCGLNCGDKQVRRIIRNPFVVDSY